LGHAGLAGSAKRQKQQFVSQIAGWHYDPCKCLLSKVLLLLLLGLQLRHVVPHVYGTLAYRPRV